MGDVGHEGALVFLHLVQFSRHVIQGGGEITHLVLGVHLDLVVQIPCGVLVGSLPDLYQGDVHHFGKYQQDDQGQGVEHCRGDVGQVQDAGAHFLHLAQGHVDQDIAVGGIVSRDGSGDGDHVLAEHAVVVSRHVGFFVRGGVKAGNGGSRLILSGSIQNQHSLPVDHPDVGV